MAVMYIFIHISVKLVQCRIWEIDTYKTDMFSIIHKANKIYTMHMSKIGHQKYGGRRITDMTLQGYEGPSSIAVYFNDFDGFDRNH